MARFRLCLSVPRLSVFGNDRVFVDTAYQLELVRVEVLEAEALVAEGDPEAARKT